MPHLISGIGEVAHQTPRSASVPDGNRHFEAWINAATSADNTHNIDLPRRRSTGNISQNSATDIHRQESDFSSIFQRDAMPNQNHHLSTTQVQERDFIPEPNSAAIQAPETQTSPSMEMATRSPDTASATEDTSNTAVESVTHNKSIWPKSFTKENLLRGTLATLAVGTTIGMGVMGGEIADFTSKESKKKKLSKDITDNIYDLARDMQSYLTENDRLRAEIDRLTTPQNSRP
jgi:hypothetical protein